MTEYSFAAWLRARTRRIPAARALNRVRVRRHAELVRQLEVFAPNSAGPVEFRSALALQSAAQTPALLAELAARSGREDLRIFSPAEFSTGADPELVRQIDMALRNYGSDKSTDHNYHLVYAAIFQQLVSHRTVSVLEVGLGTNNEDVVSSMGASAQPGASLRAFRDLRDDIHVYGADIDHRVLFTEERIETQFVDQTDPISVAALAASMPPLNLVIDDGLHSPNANLRILLLALDRLVEGGWAVIEDIPVIAQPVWEVVAQLLPAGFDSCYIRGRGGDLFVVRRGEISPAT